MKKWIHALYFHPIMLALIIVGFILPFMLISDIKTILTYEIPVFGMPFIMSGFMALWVYIAMKSEFLGRPYRKVTILLPLLQLSVYYGAALSTVIAILNKWADSGTYSKQDAILYSLLAIAVYRIFMSILYWRNPLVPRGKNQS
ncbi:MAG: hypothetical protein J7559_07700 [Cohnella sp.]|nr:hypothetical protein [Cohnella sp.]